MSQIETGTVAREVTINGIGLVATRSPAPEYVDGAGIPYRLTNWN